MTEPAPQTGDGKDRKHRSFFRIHKDPEKKKDRHDPRNIEDLYGCPNAAELAKTELSKETEVLDYD